MRKASDMSAADWQNQTHVKKIIVVLQCSYSFSQGWKSMSYSAVYLINEFILYQLAALICKHEFFIWFITLFSLPYHFQVPALPILRFNSRYVWPQFLMNLLGLTTWYDQPEAHLGSFNLHALLELFNDFKSLWWRP